MKIIIVLILSILFSIKTAHSQDLIRKTLSAGPGSDKFTFVSKNKLLWTSSGLSGSDKIKKKLKYDYKDSLLRITLFWKRDGFLEAETYYLKYDKKNEVFIDLEVPIVWHFIETKSKNSNKEKD
jgi:hypothetical protein